MNVFGFVDVTEAFTRVSLTSGAKDAAARTAAWAIKSSQAAVEEVVWDQSMMNDEVVR